MMWLVAFILSNFWAVHPALADPPCYCPEGFQVGIGGRICTKRYTKVPIRPINPSPVIAGEYDESFTSHGHAVVETDGNNFTPFRTAVYNYPVYDSNPAGSATMPGTSYPANPNGEWINYLLGLNSTPVASNMIRGEKEDTWYSKSFCLDISERKHQIFLLGGDNFWRLRIDGEDIAQCTANFCFRTALFLGRTIEPGSHFVEIKYLNTGAEGALWFLDFENPMSDLTTATSSPYLASPQTLNQKFTSGSLIGETWDYNNSEGEACDPGYSYDNCQLRTCVKFENIKCQPLLSVSQSEFTCGESIKSYLVNIYRVPVNIGVKLYRLNPDGSRVLPEVASTVKNLASYARFEGNLPQLFPGFSMNTLINNSPIPVKYELEAKVTDPDTGAVETMLAHFSIKQIATQLGISNNPRHPGSGQIASQNGNWVIFTNKPGEVVQWKASRVEPGNAPIAYSWTLTGGQPSSGTTNPISSYWDYPTSAAGAPISVHTRFPNGCESDASTILFVNDEHVPLIMNAFTPNQDGLNDTFGPPKSGRLFDWEDFSIFNRYGQRVYHYNQGGQPPGWDGYFKGQQADPGGYVYSGKWRYHGQIDGKSRDVKGNLTLIR